MKKIVKILCVLFALCILFGCESSKQEYKKNVEIEEMRSISELATVECYFHNVAKSEQFLDNSWYEFFKKDNVRFWVEYDGIVTIGIDVNKLNVSVDNNVVKIDLPQAIVLSAKVNPDSLNKDSFYYDSNSEKPDAKEETEAFKQAQQNMIDAAKTNSALLNNARENAKGLLKNYVETIGESTGIEYTIEWNYLK